MKKKTVIYSHESTFEHLIGNCLIAILNKEFKKAERFLCSCRENTNNEQSQQKIMIHLQSLLHRDRAQDGSNPLAERLKKIEW